ncbi:MAG: alpha-glucan family phosphorylase [Sumerlaeia bacterium]
MYDQSESPMKCPAKFLGTLRVLPKLPDAFQGLEDLSKNLFWAWNPSVRALFRNICPGTWRKVDGNPVRFMNNVGQKRLEEASRDQDILNSFNRVMEEYREYMSGANTWFKRETKKQGIDASKHLYAYFSAEFGLHESLPIYSGGLGILAGDHLKSASDIGLPFVATGLLYREGYFMQGIDDQGQQQAYYPPLKWKDLPITPALDAAGREIRVHVELPGRTLVVKVWKVQIGRIALHLLDTDIPENSDLDRRLTSRLYGGDQEHRIQQEVLLGIGGVRALRAAGHQPQIFHMNEGHSSFLALERVRELMHEDGLNFRDSVEVVRSTSLFTTHTPVPAGNDAFPPQLIEKYFRPFWENLGISRSEFLALGLDAQPDGAQLFSMTVLALSLSSMANGVSELHGHVSRDMWQHIFPDVPANEVPIDHITNGIHTRTWLSIDMQELLDRYFDEDWRERITDEELWKQIDRVPDEELWAVISKLRSDLRDFVQRRLVQQHSRFGESPDQLKELQKVLDPKTLTIGFARRFATYKRAVLFLRDRDRLARILNNPDRPVQMVFSGKAHPADKPGQAFIKEIVKASEDPIFRNKIVFLENYDMNVCRRMVTGVDVWLNNPRRPLEASGTSGMKVPLNGGTNCSILDGWWREAYRINPKCGFALGEDTHYDDPNLQDEADAESIYRTIEHVIAPMFYHRDAKGVPAEWLQVIRESMKTCAPLYSTNRMVQDYATKFYLKGAERNAKITASGFATAKANADWKEKMRSRWPSIRIQASVESTNGASLQTVRVHDTLSVTAHVDLGEISPKDVEVQIFIASLANSGGEDSYNGVLPMSADGQDEHGRYVYRGQLKETDSGEYGYTVRVVPKHPSLVHQHEMGLVRWAMA